MVLVDLLSKYAHLCALQHPFTTSTMAQIFMDQVFKLHGMPHSIVYDRDPTFTNNFWQELFKLQGTQLHLNTTYRPQTDGQTEVVNKCLETYLRCFASKNKNHWAQWLPLYEWWCNTSYHTTTCMTPFEAVYDKSHLQFSHTYQVSRRSRRLTKHLKFKRLFFVPSKRIWSWKKIA
jgi:hypothetical protein